MMRTIPRRRITLHFSQIFLTLALTFMATSSCFGSGIERWGFGSALYEGDDGSAAGIEARAADQNSGARADGTGEPTELLRAAGEYHGSIGDLKPKKLLR
jgi:hypothetical protein